VHNLAARHSHATAHDSPPDWPLPISELASKHDRASTVVRLLTSSAEWIITRSCKSRSRVFPADPVVRGVTRSSSAQEIRQAYRRIALTSHPDKVKAEDRDEATRKFQDIQLAYDVLQDYDRRTAYDFDTFGPSSSNIATPPSQTSTFNNGNGTFQPQRPVRNWPRDMPPSPESPGQESTQRTDRTRHSWAPGANSQARSDSWYANFHATRRDDWTFVTFKEATMMFRPEDRRHIWLCNDEDDPAVYGSSHVTKILYVSLQESIPPRVPEAFPCF